MKTPGKFLIIFFLFAQAQFSSAQTSYSCLKLVFQKTFVAADMNGGLSMALCRDSGYVVTGQHGSTGAGQCDVYVYKRNKCGQVVFFNTYGTSASEGGRCIKETADGGFIIAGLTNGGTDGVLLLKIDALGVLQWTHLYSGVMGMYVQQTSDGGYIFVAGTGLGPPTGNICLVKTDANGLITWSKTFSNASDATPGYVEQTTDGGYFISGFTNGLAGAGYNLWCIKTDAAGNLTWSKVYGGAMDDGLDPTRAPNYGHAPQSQQTADGGYIVCSATGSFGAGKSDIWLLKLDANGNVQWNKTYGGIDEEQPRSIRITADKGYIIVGWTMSFGLGEQDVYLLKTDANGTLEWSKTFGGAGREKGESVQQSPVDHGYYIDGYTASFSATLFDAYTIKTDSLGDAVCNETTPATITGTGNPTVTDVVPVVDPTSTYLRPLAFTQNGFMPGEYSLCEITTPPDVADFVNPPVCPGVPTPFTDSSKTGCSNSVIKTWLWDFGDGSAIDTVQNPVHTFAAPGTYSVILSITSKYSCVPAADTELVVVNPLPVANFTAPPVCFNNPTLFADHSAGNSTVSTWNWNFGDQNTAAIQSPSHTYGSAGAFTTTLIITNNNGCRDTFSLPVLVNPLPVSNFTSAPVCLGDTSCFTDASTVNPGSITGWTWNFGDPGSGGANTSVLHNPCHKFTGPGPFSVVLTATSDSGCQNTVTLPATMNPLPVAGIKPQNACVNSLNNFNDISVSPAGDVIDTWDWDFGDGTPHSTQKNPSHTYAAAGTYTVTLIVATAKGCKDTTNNTVIVYKLPVANFAKPDSGCAPLCVNYTDLSTSADGIINNWQWSFPGAAPASTTSHNPQNICYNTAGSYSVSLIATTQYGCKDTVTLPMIQVFPWPTADFCVTPDAAPNTDPVFSFCDQWSSDVVQWAWSFGDNDSDFVSTDPVHSYSATATKNDFYDYQICIRVENVHGCWDTACKSVELIPEFTFYIPNTFTPNSDNNNELFFGKGRGIKDYNIWVFDRWGNQLWDCHHSGKNTDWDGPGQDGLSAFCQWDGKVVQGGQDMSGYSNTLAQEDVYVWKVQLTDIFSKKHTYIGHVNIVR